MSQFHDTPPLPFAPRSRSYQGVHGRLFPHLPPFEPRSTAKAQTEDAYYEATAKGMVDSSGGDEGDNPIISAAYTYLAQFITHDLTFDPVTLSGQRRDPDRISMVRTPRLDLDSLYGRGPTLDCPLYDWTAADRTTPNRVTGYRLRVGRRPLVSGHRAAELDLPRVEGRYLKLRNSRNEVDVLRPSDDAVHVGVEEYLKKELGEASAKGHRLAVHTRERRIACEGDIVAHHDQKFVPVVDHAAGGDGVVRVMSRDGKGTEYVPVDPESVVTLGLQALIGDPRNDENILISQLHLAFIRFHNAVIGRFHPSSGSPRSIFLAARQAVVWHFQWLVIHDLLASKLCAAELVHDLIDGGSIHDGGSRTTPLYEYKQEPFIPVEFSAAAFRFGHTMIRSSYQLNDSSGRIPTLLGKGVTDVKSDLRGFRRLPERFTVQWDHFLDVPGSKVTPQSSRLINERISPSLANLEGVSPGSTKSLVLRDLQKGQQLGLPSGLSVRQYLGYRELPRQGHETMEDAEEIPLWQYVLRESDRYNGGKHLGPVGQRIVAETLIGIIRSDPDSYLALDPKWRPFLGRNPGSFSLEDLLWCAKMPLTAADLPFPTD